MRCVVINLVRATARRQAMVEQLQAHGVDFEILNATDWQELTEQDFASVDTITRERQGRRALSKAMIACAISHRRAFERLVSCGEEMMVVLEDDVTLSADFRHLLALVESRNIDFDMIFLLRQKSKNAFLPVKHVGEYRLGLVRYSDYGTVGYIVTRNAAQRYLELTPKIVHQIDHSLHAYWEHGLNIFSLEPPVVHHGNQSGEHSFLQEVQSPRHHRSITSRINRVQTELTERFRKQRMYRERVRELLDQMS